jgi:hypothetical protein
MAPIAIINTKLTTIAFNGRASMEDSRDMVREKGRPPSREKDQYNLFQLVNAEVPAK